MSAARAEYGPSLPELIGPRRWRLVSGVAVLVVAVVVLVALISRETEHTLVNRAQPPFNFIYEAPLQRFGSAGVQERRRGLFVQSMVVHSLRLPVYRGDPAGTLPIVADRLAVRLARELDGFRVVREGRARVNESVGYVIGWEARLGERKLFGRDYLLVPEEDPHPTLGVRLELRSTYAGRATSSDDVGRYSPLKKPLRSFRFGTERP